MASKTLASFTILDRPEEISDFYREHGFVIIDNLLTTNEVNDLFCEIKEICRGNRGHIPGMKSIEEGQDADVFKQYLAIHFPHKISKIVKDLVSEEKTVRILRCCIGPNVKCMQTILFTKGPGRRGQACHQDEYYIPTRDRSLCASWIALDPATVENGGLWVIPGSHKAGIIWPTRDHRDNRFDVSRECYNHGYGEEDWVPVELSSGSAVFFNGYLLHRSSPNLSQNYRRAFANHYMSAESLLPWTNDGRFDVKPTGDMRDVIPVCGVDPYAEFHPFQELTKPFLRAEIPEEIGGFGNAKS